MLCRLAVGLVSPDTSRVAGPCPRPAAAAVVAAPSFYVANHGTFTPKPLGVHGGHKHGLYCALVPLECHALQSGVVGGREAACSPKLLKVGQQHDNAVAAVVQCGVS